MSPEVPRFDAIVIGAGVSGLCQLIRLRELGLSTLVFEAGTDVGGTWYWNRYPGARFDSESYTYSYSFDSQLLDEWRWSEHFAAQPETLRYLKHVADRFDLRRDIRFETRVEKASWVEDETLWRVEAEDGFEASASFLVTAIGALSAPVTPEIEGLEAFTGGCWHTARWPHEPISFEGKRVGVIGTGATGVQLIQEVAKTARQLSVFQRHPNWCAPLHNRPIDDEEWAELQKRQRALLAQCNESMGGFLHDADPRKATEVSEEEREAFYEELYASPGFGIWFGNFRDLLIDPVANKTISDFIARKIRERVDSPEIAEKLIPKDHGFGTRRVPMESDYYEAYNQRNVTLVDLNETPIERVLPSGVRTTGGDHELDYLLLATGFDAVTGAFDRIEFRGTQGRTLAEAWADGPTTYLGIQTPGLPNLFTLVGPHNVSTFCNMPRCIEQNVEWVTDCIGYLRANGHDRIEATPAAADEWTQHAHEAAEKLLMSRVDSWFTGQNSNLPGRKRQVLIYAGGLPLYRETCDLAAADGYAGFDLR